MSIESFLETIGIATELQIDTEELKLLKRRAERLDITIPENRYRLINDFFIHFSSAYITNWISYFPKKELSEEMRKKISHYIISVSMIYNHSANKFLYYVDKNYLLGSKTINDIYQETEVLEFLSPGWSLSHIFMENEYKSSCAEERLIEVVKNIVEKKGILNALYEQLPELLKKFNEDEHLKGD